MGWVLLLLWLWRTQQSAASGNLEFLSSRKWRLGGLWGTDRASGGCSVGVGGARHRDRSFVGVERSELMILAVSLSQHGWYYLLFLLDGAAKSCRGRTRAVLSLGREAALTLVPGAMTAELVGGSELYWGHNGGLFIATEEAPLLCDLFLMFVLFDAWYWNLLVSGKAR